MGRCRCCLLVAASLLTTAAAAAFGWFYVWQVLYAPYLQGARDIVYDAARERVIISALHSNVIAVVDVATPSKPRTLGWRADDAFTNAHGFAYDHGSATAYVASYGRGSLAKVDLRNPARDKLPVVATLKNDELYSATHASYDAARNLVFVTAAGSHGLSEDVDVLRGGHDLLVVDAATMRRTGLLTEWGAGAEPAYPVYCVYDAARALLFASNDARNRLEVVDVSDAAQPAVVGEVAAAPELAYVSQLALDAPSNLIIAASQKGDSVAVVDVADAANPKILGSLTSDALDGATGVAYDAARRLAYVASEFAGTLSVVNVTDRATPVIVAGVCAPCGNRPASLGRPRHRADVVSMAWGVAATISAQVAHDALQGGEAVAFDAARRRVFVASRTSACLVEADVRDAAAPTVVAALCTPRTPADAVKVVAMVAGSLLFFLLALWLAAAACSRKRYARQGYGQVDTFDEDGYDLGDFELGRLETKDEYCDDDDDDDEEGLPQVNPLVVPPGKGD